MQEHSLDDAAMAQEPETVGLPDIHTGKSLETAFICLALLALLSAGLLVCIQVLICSSGAELVQSPGRFMLLSRIQMFLAVALLIVILGAVTVFVRMVYKPLVHMVKKTRAQETIEPAGADELRFIAGAYNSALLEGKQARDNLSHQAARDALTGLLNRGAYDLLMKSADVEHLALILVDVDDFKDVNDTYGHAMGDRVLQRVAEILRDSFRSVDIVFRMGGDEFVVVMTRADSSMERLVVDRVNRANDLLQHPENDLPPVSMSVGVAFSDRLHPKGDLYEDADAALYRVKNSGKCGCKIFE